MVLEQKHSISKKHGSKWSHLGGISRLCKWVLSLNLELYTLSCRLVYKGWLLLRTDNCWSRYQLLGIFLYVH